MIKFPGFKTPCFPLLLSHTHATYKCYCLLLGHHPQYGCHLWMVLLSQPVASMYSCIHFWMNEISVYQHTECQNSYHKLSHFNALTFPCSWFLHQNANFWPGALGLFFDKLLRWSFDFWISSEFVEAGLERDRCILQLPCALTAKGWIIIRLS